jgi:hypothetical protein
MSKDNDNSSSCQEGPQLHTKTASIPKYILCYPSGKYM